MIVSVESKPSYAMAMVNLDPGDELIAEGGCMVAMSPAVGVDTAFNGTIGTGFVGFLKAAFMGLIRRFLGGETMFVNRYTGTAPGQVLMLAPALVGDVEHFQLTPGRTLMVQGGSYLASAPTVTVDLVWGGFSMLLSGEGAFFLECSGQGDLLVNAYGAIEKVEIDGSYVVDSGHVVCWDAGLSHELSRAGGGWGTALLSGEGFVLTFTGKGTVWLQTRHLGSLISWVTPLLP